MTPSLRDLVFHNFSWKVTSILIAILIWVTIYANQSGLKLLDIFRSREIRPMVSQRRRLPVTVITPATDMRRFSITPKEVEVSIRGEAAVLDKLKVSDLAAFVNLTDVNDDVFSQKRVNIYAPTNVTPVSVVPEEVAVERVAPADPAGSHRD